MIYSSSILHLPNNLQFSDFKWERMSSYSLNLNFFPSKNIASHFLNPCKPLAFMYCGKEFQSLPMFHMKHSFEACQLLFMSASSCIRSSNDQSCPLHHKGDSLKYTVIHLRSKKHLIYNLYIWREALSWWPPIFKRSGKWTLETHLLQITDCSSNKTAV